MCLLTETGGGQGGTVQPMCTKPALRTPTSPASADAVWWAATMITTVGYGDRYPVTGTGRIIAAVMMFIGIGRSQ